MHTTQEKNQVTLAAKRRRSATKYLTLFVTVLFLAACVIVMLKNYEKIRQLDQIPIGFLLLSAVMFILNIMIRAIFNWSLFRRSGFKIPLVRYIVLFLFSTSLSFFAPASGSVYAAQYLKSNCNMDIGRFVGVFGGFNLLIWLSGSILGLVFLIAAWYASGVFYAELTLLFFAMILALCLLMSDAFHRLVSQSIVHDRLLRVVGGVRSLVNSYSIVALSVLTVAGLVLTTYTAVWALCAGSDFDVDAIQLALLVLSQVLGGIVPISPGGIGIQEAAAVAFGASMSLELVDLFLIFVLWRVLRMLVLLTLMLPARMYLHSRPNHA